MRASFRLVLARLELTPVRRQVFDPDDVSVDEGLVDAVGAASYAAASGLIPSIESDGVVFHRQHIEVLAAELDEKTSHG